MSTQTAWVKPVLKPQTRAILGLMRLNFLYAGSRSQLRAMHNSPNTVNPTKIKVVEPQLAADPYGLRGSAADSSGGRILASAGGDLSTYSGKPLSLPAKASNDLDAALDWMQREGRNIEQYVNKKAAPMQGCVIQCVKSLISRRY